MGIQSIMKTCLVLLAFACLGFAHMTEPDSVYLQVDPPPGEEDSLAMIQEGAGADVTKLRVTWKTKADPCPATGDCSSIKSSNEKYASAASFKITITGAGGNVEDELFKHPGEVKNKDTGLYDKAQGLVQNGEVDPKKDLGQLKSVKITTTATTDKSWTPSYVKINTNNKYTGLGSGVYYVPINRAIDKDNAYEAKVSPGDGENKMDKCTAQFCEEEMDKKLGLAQEASKKKQQH